MSTPTPTPNGHPAEEPALQAPAAASSCVPPPVADVITELRPEFFAEVCGQQQVISQIQRALASDQMPHAMLFVGPMGSGKTTLARIVSAAACCTGYAPGAIEPCGDCEFCISGHGNMWRKGVTYYWPGRSVPDQVFWRDVFDVAHHHNLWPGRKSVLLVDDIDSLPLSQQRILRGMLDWRWTHSICIGTTANPGRLDEPLKQRMMICPMSAPSRAEMVAWCSWALQRLQLVADDEKAIETLAMVAGYNFRAVLQILSVLNLQRSVVTCTAVRLAALQCGYGT